MEKVGVGGTANMKWWIETRNYIFKNNYWISYKRVKLISFANNLLAELEL